MKTRTHYRPGIHPPALTPSVCGTWQASRFTAVLAEVDCRACLARVARLGLRPRAEFPEVPTFAARPDGPDTCSFVCPVCGKRNHHGRGDGHRHAHCSCWPRGYNIRVSRG